MDIQLTEEQELLRSSIQRFLREQYDFDERLLRPTKAGAASTGAPLPSLGCARHRFRKVPGVLVADRLRQ